MGFTFQQRASQYITNTYRTSESKVMVLRICVGFPYQLSSPMIYYGPQSDIRVKTFARRNLSESTLFVSECLNWFSALYEDPEEMLWSFVFAKGFTFQQRASQYIINIYRTSESKLLPVGICPSLPC